MPDTPIVTLPLLRLGRLQLDPGLRALQPGTAASGLVVTATIAVPDSSADRQYAWHVAWIDAACEAGKLGADQGTARALAGDAGRPAAAHPAPVTARCDTGGVKRERAMQLAGQVLQGLDEGQDEWPLSLVTELHVFGSFARGAPEPHDVDLDIEHISDYRWGSHFATCLAYGRDPYSLMKRPLTGGKRGCQITFRFKDSADFPMTLLWRKGDPLPAALERLHAIQPDPAAGRAPRDAMLPQFSTRHSRATDSDGASCATPSSGHCRSLTTSASGRCWLTP